LRSKESEVDPGAMTPVPRLRHYDGPAILSAGFRPFFFFGAFYAGVAVLIWAAMLRAEVEPRWSRPLLDVNALAWVAAFLGFCVIYGPALWCARRSKAQTT
jgi:uncharacterized protein involved in response to NO